MYHCCMFMMCLAACSTPRSICKHDIVHNRTHFIAVRLHCLAALAAEAEAAVLVF